MSLTDGPGYDINALILSLIESVVLYFMDKIYVDFYKYSILFM